MGANSINYETVHLAVKDYGMSLIALFDHVAATQLSELVGVDYHGVSNRQAKSTDSALMISTEHFITSPDHGIDTSLLGLKRLCHLSVHKSSRVTLSTWLSTNPMLVAFLCRSTQNRPMKYPLP